jgi:hypothetical protein
MTNGQILKSNLLDLITWNWLIWPENGAAVASVKTLNPECSNEGQNLNRSGLLLAEVTPIFTLLLAEATLGFCFLSRQRRWRIEALAGWERKKGLQGFSGGNRGFSRYSDGVSQQDLETRKELGLAVCEENESWERRDYGCILGEKGRKNEEFRT